RCGLSLPTRLPRRALRREAAQRADEVFRDTTLSKIPVSGLAGVEEGRVESAPQFESCDPRRREGRGGLQVIGINLDRHALQDDVECNHHPEVAFPAYQHTFHSGQRAALNPDALTENEVGMGLDLPLRAAGAQRLDFKI